LTRRRSRKISRCGHSEAREAIYWLRLLDATAGTTDHRCKELIAEAEEIAKIVGSIVVKARGQVKH